MLQKHPQPKDSRHFSDRALDAIAGKGPACVGLDPVLDKLPDEIRAKHWEPVRAIEAFTRDVLDAAADHTAIVKFQSACFERFGPAGLAALERTAQHAKSLGLLIILDAKRGDIGISAQHYAAAAQAFHADAITVNPYLGVETIEPYLAQGLGVFALVRTSNPGSDSIQSQPLADTRTVAQLVADEIAALGSSHMGTRSLSNVGAVVGATKADDARALRQRMPNQLFLIPGFGAQGGTLDDIKPMLGPTTPSVIVTASRSVLYPPPDATPWQARIAAAAAHFAHQLRHLAH